MSILSGVLIDAFPLISISFLASVFERFPLSAVLSDARKDTARRDIEQNELQGIASGFLCTSGRDVRIGAGNR